MMLKKKNMQEAKTLIEVEKLTKKYGNHVAVDNLSFRVERGMVYGFLGPNGAGKSTTMNMMTGYIAATSGTVKINGYDMLKEPEKAKKCIGYLPELPPVYQDMTVREYLTFASELKKIPKRERKEQITQVMEQTKIADVKDRLIKNLSKGYKQRVGLAQAILGDPQVIILDEPTVGLDPKQIIEIRELIRELAKKHTVILSSHILSEVSAVCDHIMIISKGKLVACDTPEGLLTLFSGVREMNLAVEGRRAHLEEILKQFTEIQAYEILEEKEAGIVRVQMKADAESDIRKELFFALAKEQMPIMELSMTEKSLEDVFLELTGDASQEDSNETEDQLDGDMDVEDVEEITQEQEEQDDEGDI